MEVWLADNGVTANRIVEVREPLSLGFSITPTLLAVNSAGLVTDVMIGQLTAPEMDRVLAELDGNTSEPLDNSGYAREISREEFNRLTHQDGPLVIDVRDRRAYDGERRPNRLYIPYDELAERARIEVPDSPIIVDCSESEDRRVHRCRLAAQFLQASRSAEVLIFVP